MRGVGYLLFSLISRGYVLLVQWVLDSAILRRGLFLSRFSSY